MKPAEKSVYVDLLGHSTWTWLSGDHDDTVLLLHGGLSNSEQHMLEPLGTRLDDSYRIAAFDRRGHGRTADTSEPFHYAAMADETIAFLEHLGGQAHLVGWSDGGIVGLLVALRRPDLVKRVVAIGANYHHDGIPADFELDPESEVVAMLVGAYAELSPDGPEHFEEVAGKVMAMAMSEPTLTPADLSTVSVPVLVMVGDDDLIGLAHTCSLYESIPQAQLAVVPGTSHMLPMEDPGETVRIIKRFLQADLPPSTMMPNRRI